MKPEFDYYYGQEAEQFTFYRIPKVLFTSDVFHGLSSDAKVLYGLMLDRMSLSLKNQWLDEMNRVFIYFTLEDVMKYMNCGHNKGVRIMAELDSEKGIGLIERVKQGLGKPTKIYVKSFMLTQLEASITDKENDCELSTKLFTEEVQTSSPSGQDEIDRWNGYRQMIIDNIEYESLFERFGDIATEILDIMVETVCSNRESIRIDGSDFPATVVRSQLLKLNYGHVE